MFITIRIQFMMKKFTLGNKDWKYYWNKSQDDL